MSCPHWVTLGWGLSQVWSAYLAPVSRGSLGCTLPVCIVYYQAGGHLEHGLPSMGRGTEGMNIFKIIVKHRVFI